MIECMGVCVCMNSAGEVKSANNLGASSFTCSAFVQYIHPHINLSIFAPLAPLRALNLHLFRLLYLRKRHYTIVPAFRCRLCSLEDDFFCGLILGLMTLFFDC